MPSGHHHNGRCNGPDCIHCLHDLRAGIFGHRHQPGDSKCRWLRSLRAWHIPGPTWPGGLHLLSVRAHACDRAFTLARNCDDRVEGDADHCLLLSPSFPLHSALVRRLAGHLLRRRQQVEQRRVPHGLILRGQLRPADAVPSGHVGRHAKRNPPLAVHPVRLSALLDCRRRHLQRDLRPLRKHAAHLASHGRRRWRELPGRLERDAPDARLRARRPSLSRYARLVHGRVHSRNGARSWCDAVSQ